MSDTQEEHQAGERSGPFVRMWFETTMGVRYEMPDMLPRHVEAAHKQLDSHSSITVMNVSGVIMVIPKHILKKAGVGDRCFWEAE